MGNASVNESEASGDGLLASLYRDRRVLESLTADFTAVYIIDLDTGMAEVMKVGQDTNASVLLGGSATARVDWADVAARYIQSFIPQKERAALTSAVSLVSLGAAVAGGERTTFRYEAFPNKAGHRFFEGQIVPLAGDEASRRVLLGFRYIDPIVEEERIREARLKVLLQEQRLSNEILSAISKIYFMIYHIDLSEDFYEEISSYGDAHRLTGDAGRASKKLLELAEVLVDDDYQEAVITFFNLQTLPARLASCEDIAIEYLMRDGNWHTARFIARRRDDAGALTHVLLVTSSISDARRREEKLTIIAQSERAANEAKTDFLSRMAHDIRTPMNAIQGFNELAKKDAGDPAKLSEDLERVSEGCKLLTQIVNDVLEIARIEKGAMDLHAEPTSVREFFGSLERLSELKGENDIRITKLDLHDVQHDVLVFDPLRLRQVVMNLLSNASKYTPLDGRVELEMFEGASTRKGCARLVAKVSDTGRGMSPEFMQRMYNRFEREHDTRVSAIRGSGLGLSIVKEVVDLMGGTITCQSEVGEGTRFTVTFDFPIAGPSETKKPEAPAEELSLEEAKEVCRGLRVLIAEDNDLNYELESTLLGVAGVTCERAVDGFVAQAMFSASPDGYYDAILMDMQMPKMTGIESARAVRAVGTNYARRIPIIALTANAFKRDRKACLEAGMDAHLAKPFNAATVLRTLAHLASHPRE